jgi:hypothetical protein
MQRRHPNHERLIEEARRLREEAAKIPDGLARHLLLQQAFRAETAVNVDRWLSSPGWQPRNKKAPAAIEMIVGASPAMA